MAFVLTMTQLPRSLLLPNTSTTMAKQQPAALRVLSPPHLLSLPVLQTQRPHVDWVLLCPKKCSTSSNPLNNKPTNKKTKPLDRRQALIVSTQPVYQPPTYPSLLCAASTLRLLLPPPLNPDLLPRLPLLALPYLLLARLPRLLLPPLANNPHYLRDFLRDRTQIPISTLPHLLLPTRKPSTHPPTYLLQTKVQSIDLLVLASVCQPSTLPPGLHHPLLPLNRLNHLR